MSRIYNRDVIYSLSGKLKQRRDRFLIIGIGGVEFKVMVPATSESRLPQIGESLMVYTFLHIREGGADLYGFLSEEELSFFESLISVSGIGPKTASQLVTKFGNLENIYEHIGEVESERFRKTLAENSESAALAKKLATIVRDVPITLNIEKCKLGNLDRPHVHKMLEDLEFRSLITRLGGSKNQELRIKNNEKPRREEKKGDNTQQIKLF